eukprot:m.58406 g.58406  ORF g.58406 m.58406 type:complete len:75 (+) comp49152_c0_seq5:222-446(+)
MNLLLLAAEEPIGTSADTTSQESPPEELLHATACAEPADDGRATQNKFHGPREALALVPVMNLSLTGADLDSLE